ncbi:MAG: 30S ribosomal protein S16 [Streptosporangiales bacterium]|nr:30S ribosomal protein S16 [Streptosporangiales bacterium]
MAVKIKLKRMGKMRAPHYRIIIADARTKRDGRAIEEIGLYHPKEEPSLIQVDSERVQYWLSVGAQPTEPVERLLKLTGDWQKFKGEKAPPPLKVAEPKPSKDELYAEAAKDVLGDDAGAATTPKKKRSEGKKTEKKADKADKGEKADKADKGEKAEDKKAAKAEKSDDKKGAKAEESAEPAAAQADEAPAAEKTEGEA